jgi:ABC-type multidrug transport system permease subunit
MSYGVLCFGNIQFYFKIISKTFLIQICKKGLAISSWSDNEVEVLQIAVGTIFPSLLISGIIWPIEAMPGWVKVLTNFSPITHTAAAMRDVACRGWGITYFSVWFGFVVILLWIGFFNLIAAIVFTIRQ